MKKIILFLFFWISFSSICFSQDVEHLYSTWDVLESDTCASAWLIKSFVDSKAEFKFYPKGEFIALGIAFDVPDAKFRRMENMSCFEAILKEYNIEDKNLIEIGNMIRALEIEFWTGKATQEAKILNQKIIEIINSSSTPQEAFQRSFLIFDKLYQDLTASSDSAG